MPRMLRQYFNLAVFPTGRRLFALRRVRAAAERLGMDDLASHVDERIGFDEQTMVMEYDWTGARRRRSRARGQAAKIDNDLDRTVGAIHNLLRNTATCFGPNHPHTAKATKMLSCLFPQGAARITTKVFEEQLATVDWMLSMLQNDFANDVAELGLGAAVERLATLNEAFRTELKSSPAKKIEFSQLRAARERGQEGLLEVFSRVLGTWNGPSDEHVRMRSILLEGIIDQDRRIRANLRRTHRPVDVDPETGQEESAPGLDKERN